jgi:beta-lactamase class A
MIVVRARRAVGSRALPLAAFVLMAAGCGAGDSTDTAAPAPRDTAPVVAEAPAWSPDSLESAIGAIVAEAGSEVGVAAIHLETGRRVEWNGDRRLPMASVYKLPIALEVLYQVERGTISLDDSITIHPGDFVGGANPLTSSAGGRPVTATVGRLLAYMLAESDNTATDALIRAVGGPPAVRRRLVELGIEGIDVSRYEAEIFAEARARARTGLGPDRDDPRDAATAEALADLLALVYRDAVLDAGSRALLLAHLASATRGQDRIKGLLPPGTPVAHKTGSFGPVTNDVGIVTLPDGSHVAIAVLVHGPAGPAAERERTIARVARAVYDAFGPPPVETESSPPPS